MTDRKGRERRQVSSWVGPALAGAAFVGAVGLAAVAWQQFGQGYLGGAGITAKLDQAAADALTPAKPAATPLPKVDWGQTAMPAALQAQVVFDFEPGATTLTPAHRSALEAGLAKVADGRLVQAEIYLSPSPYQAGFSAVNGQRVLDDLRAALTARAVDAGMIIVRRDPVAPDFGPLRLTLVLAWTPAP